MKNWVYKAPSVDLIKEISEKLEISRTCASVLANRGISCATDAERFLNPDIDNIPNPFLLPDMEKAVERIRRAVDNKEKILVYGDRDVDGITSVCIMIRTLKALGIKPLWNVPSNEGYGIHKEIIERYHKQGVSLIITVDCGISAISEAEYIKSLGIDLIVTDHHEQSPLGLPHAVAVVDPKRLDSKYPFSEVAGCLISYKVAEALMLSFGRYYDREMVVTSIETTGINPLEDEICEVSAIKIKNGIITDTFSKLAVPEKGLPDNFCREHRVPDDALTKAMPVKDVLKEFRNFAGASIIVAHDAEYNLGFLKHFIVKYFKNSFDNKVIDTLELARKHLPESSHSLDNLASILRLDYHSSTNTIRAQNDAMLTYKVFLKLQQRDDLRMDFFRKDNLDLIALGTIADIMPLMDENRVLVKEGLKQIAKSSKVGISALLERCKRKNSNSNGLTAKYISWYITPILNAAGRLGRADLGIELLLCEDAYTAHELLDEILQMNNARRELQSENLEKFLPLLSEQCDLENDKIFVVTAEGLEHGVTGIIASQIARQYNKPTILLIVEGDEAIGAARSIGGFDIVSVFNKLDDIITKYGGHAQAAGLTIKADRIKEFCGRIKEIAEKEMTPELLTPVLNIDAELDISEANIRLLNELHKLEPFGAGNPYPVFFLNNVSIVGQTQMGTNGVHLKLLVSKSDEKSGVLEAVGWRLGSMKEVISSCNRLDMAAQLELNVWKSRKKLQLKIVDLKCN